MKILTTKSLIFIAILSMNFSTGCEKEKKPVEPVLITTSVSNITAISAVSGGNITSDGGATVTVRGVCWSTGITPSISDSKTTDGAGAGSFTSNISGLFGGTVYYVRAYATNSKGTGYGMTMSFTTTGEPPSAPIASATNASQVQLNSATINGIVNAKYYSTSVIFEYGTSISYGQTITATQSPVIGGTNTNVNASITGLTIGTIYHYRIKAVNSLGTTTSNDMTFTTLGQAPTATTQLATNINTFGATLNGTVNPNSLSTTVTFEYGITSSYGSSITATQSPVTGNSNSSVNAILSGLAPNTTYYFRLKTVNTLGTNYGNEQTFKTLGQLPTTTTQAATNISSTSATINGIVNANLLSTSVSFEYGTSTSYGNTITATQSPVTGSSNTNVSVAVTGLLQGTTYHYRIIATNSLGTTTSNDMTFKTLGSAPAVNVLAATGITLNSAQLNGNVNPNYLESSVTFEYGTTTSYGMTAAAIQSPIMGNSNTIVSASIMGLSEGTTYHYRITATNALGTTNSNDMTFTTLGQAPSVITQSATNITLTSAQLNGTINANYLESQVTFEYGLTASYGQILTATESPVLGNTATNVSASVSGLTVGTTYHFRIKATNSLGTNYGNDMTFTTLSTISDIDGNIYNVFMIGNQVWMKENLRTSRNNDGSNIPYITNNSSWSSLNPAYCWYNNDVSNKTVYGAMYNWYAINTGKLCPIGWHVSTDSEWTTLTTYLGGESVAGGKLKEIGTTHWASPNTGATDDVGFIALPGGFRYSSDGSFTPAGYYGRWWTSTDGGDIRAWGRGMDYNNSTVGRYNSDKKLGNSVRCIMD